VTWIIHLLLALSRGSALLGGKQASDFKRRSVLRSTHHASPAYVPKWAEPKR